MQVEIKCEFWHYAVPQEISRCGPLCRILIRMDKKANALFVCLDSGVKKVLLLDTSVGKLGMMQAELVELQFDYLQQR